MDPLVELDALVANLLVTYENIDTDAESFFEYFAQHAEAFRRAHHRALAAIEVERRAAEERAIHLCAKAAISDS